MKLTNTQHYLNALRQAINLAETSVLDAILADHDNIAMYLRKMGTALNAPADVTFVEDLMGHLIPDTLKVQIFPSAKLEEIGNYLGIKYDTLLMGVLPINGELTLTINTTRLRALLIEGGSSSAIQQLLLETMHHELTHVDQVTRGDLSWGEDGSIIWKGVSYPQTWYTGNDQHAFVQFECDNKPWELEAYASQYSHNKETYDRAIAYGHHAAIAIFGIFTKWQTTQ